jgi:hypothetical protein
MSDKTLIVIQGPTSHKTEMFRTYKDYPHIAWSTWDNEKIDNPPSNFTMIYNKIPRHAGFTRINFQCVSSKTGCEHATDNEYKYCLKVRSDIVISDPLKLINHLQNRCKIENRIYVIAYQNNMRTGIIPVDYVVFGTTERMNDYWSYYEPSMVTHPAEMKIMRKYLTKYAHDIPIPTVHAHKHEITLTDMNKYYGTFLQELVNNEIDIIWISRNDKKRYKHPNRDGVYVNKYTSDKWYLYNK